MRGNKPIAILLVVLGGLLGVWLVRGYAPEAKVTDQYGQSLPTVKAEEVDQIELKGTGRPVILVKAAGGWQVGDYPADGSKVESLINGLMKPEKAGLAAETAASHERLGVASESGTLVRLTGGGNQGEWWVGKEAVSGGTYVRVGGGELVFGLTGLPTVAGTTNNDWINKTITTIPETEIQTLTVERRNGTTITLVRRGSDWLEEGKEVVLDPAPITAMTTNLAALVTQGLVEAETELPSQPELRVKVTLQKGEETLSFYPLTDETYALQATSRPGNYRVGTSVVEAFEIERADLQPKPAATPTAMP